MEKRYCFRCGKELKPGNLFYVVLIKVISGFDGILSEPAEGIDQQLKGLLEEVLHADPKEMEKDVYEEITLMSCKSCRDRFVDEIRHPWEGPFQIQKEPDSILH
ncbi:MAG TPA: hypothetical protein VLZ03_15255 [Thermodesulfobacteriota bacterium]|nr:hypothetical protein [Thermodesulfobacteriota bacterium]